MMSPAPRKKINKSLAPAESARIEEIFARLAAANPEPKGELHYANPFTLLVAVVL
ncbi:MAG: endonuclease III, partial [Methylocystis sp.]|nr:endonuclease III [Methylocystis sp.]